MRAILIDDEPLALEYLAHQLSDLDLFEIVGKFEDPYSGRQAVETNEVDLVFLDINIPGMNGMELAEQLLELKPSLHIVFVTAYDDFAIRAFELNALDYVLKPVSKQRLRSTFERIHFKAPPELPPRKKQTLRMNLFRRAIIMDQDGNQLPVRWRTTKVMQVFLYLVHHRGSTVHKSTLVDLLWSDLERGKAYQQLYTAIYNIRKTLGPYEHYFKISNLSDGYSLTMEDVRLDIDQFERIIQTDADLSDETIHEYELAIGAYAGDYLSEYDYVWAESERHRLQQHWLQISLKMVAWYCANHKLDKAMKLCLDITHRFPLEEEASLQLMQILAAKGLAASVHREYLRITELIRTELQEPPSPWIREWYHHWKTNEKE